MMNALEAGRVNVAAGGVGIGQRALELALENSESRKSFGRPIRQHQAIAFRLAEMATDLEAARNLTRFAASEKDRTGSAAREAGIAKLFASEAAHRIVESSFRIHGGYGYSREYEIERLYRPLLLIGEGTSDIQKLLISRSLLYTRYTGYTGYTDLSSRYTSFTTFLLWGLPLTPPPGVSC